MFVFLWTQKWLLWHSDHESLWRSKKYFMDNGQERLKPICYKSFVYSEERLNQIPNIFRPKTLFAIKTSYAKSPQKRCNEVGKMEKAQCCAVNWCYSVVSLEKKSLVHARLSMNWNDIWSNDFNCEISNTILIISKWQLMATILWIGRVGKKWICLSLKSRFYLTWMSEWVMCENWR